MGVIMLTAISYVTLSTGERPFRAINKHINPVLGWGWLIATCMANMIWCMPQYSVSFAALQKNLLPNALPDTPSTKLALSAVLFAAALLTPPEACLRIDRVKGLRWDWCAVRGTTWRLLSSPVYVTP